METTSPAIPLHLLGDTELLGLLRTEEDRLTRPIVDEFVRRGPAMIGPLTEICRADGAWERKGALFWTPIHAAFILGAIRSEEALPGLMAALRLAPKHEVDWVVDALPSMLGFLGRAATPALKLRVLDRRTPEEERELALHGLAGVAAHNPIEQGEVLDFLRIVAEDDTLPNGVRIPAAYVLLQFARPGDQALVMSLAVLQEWMDGIPLFSREEVKEAYRRGVQSIEDYLVDWREFYHAREIDARARRWYEEEEDDRWAQAVDEGAPWIEDDRAQLLRRYEWSLMDLDDSARGDALWVAESMTEYLVRHEGCAPWRWNGSTAFAFMIDYLARRIAMDSPGPIKAVPDNLLRFVRFCELEGRLSEEDRREVEECVAAEREGFLEAARDPETRRRAREVLERLMAGGVDPADREATRAWIANGTKPQAPPLGHVLPFPQVDRNAPCPRGSGKKLKRCCGRRGGNC